jgi:hypothetical protein
LADILTLQLAVAGIGRFQSPVPIPGRLVEESSLGQFLASIHHHPNNSFDEFQEVGYARAS